MDKFQQKFMKQNIIIGKPENLDWGSNQFTKHIEHIEVNFKCPFCNNYKPRYMLWFEHRPRKKKPLFLGEDLLVLQHKFFHWNYIRHITFKIRFHGCIKHMDLFLDLYGKEFAIRKFREWEEQSLVVHNNLKEYISKLNQNRPFSEQSTQKNPQS